MMVPGSVIPDACYIAMGSLVRGELEMPKTLYAGIPARAIRDIGDEAFFKRNSRRANVP
jgi:acetyltransferase-like isoleucine patch superfamily enzyme